MGQFTRERRERRIRLTLAATLGAHGVALSSLLWSAGSAGRAVVALVPMCAFLACRARDRRSGLAPARPHPEVR